MTETPQPSPEQLPNPQILLRIEIEPQERAIEEPCFVCDSPTVSVQLPIRWFSQDQQIATVADVPGYRCSNEECGIETYDPFGVSELISSSTAAAGHTTQPMDGISSLGPIPIQLEHPA